MNYKKYKGWKQKRIFWQKQMWLAEDNGGWFYEVAKAEFEKFNRVWNDHNPKDKLKY